MTRTVCRSRCKHPAGFTLLELLVVTSILSLLLAIALPSYRRAQEDARRSVCLSNIKHVGIGLFTYAAENNDKAPPVMDRMGRTAPRVLLSRSGRLVNLGHLVERYLDQPEVFFCPSQTRFNFNNQLKYLSRGTVGGSYAYAVHIPAGQTREIRALRHLAMVSDDFVSYRHGDGVGRYAHRTGYNVLYTDGSASWYHDADMSIARQQVHWDDETDDITYETYYNYRQGGQEGQGGQGDQGDGNSGYGNRFDVFRVWYSFCYNVPDPF